MSSIETKKDKIDGDINEPHSFTKKLKRTLSNFFYNLKLFLKKNIPELIIVFILILILVLTQSTNKTKWYQSGGDDPPPQQPSESSIRTKQMVSQIGQKIRSNQTVQTFLTTIYSVLNAVYIFGILIFTLAVVPALPLFGFMFIIFVILRNRIASLKAL
jgi:Na+/H+ antiporter NhaC